MRVENWLSRTSVILAVSAPVVLGADTCVTLLEKDGAELAGYIHEKYETAADNSIGVSIC